jgi:hypothetical protein
MNRAGDPPAYWSVRDPEKHRFKKLDGYAVSISVLNEVKDEDIATVFIDEVGGPIYEFDVVQFAVDGVELNFDGHDEQLCLPVSDARAEWGGGE